MSPTVLTLDRNQRKPTNPVKEVATQSAASQLIFSQRVIFARVPHWKHARQSAKEANEPRISTNRSGVLSLVADHIDRLTEGASTFSVDGAVSITISAWFSPVSAGSLDRSGHLQPRLPAARRPAVA